MNIEIDHITDLHLDEKLSIDLGVKARENWKIILEHVSESQITDVVFTGDIGTYESNKWSFNSTKLNDSNFKFVLGIHDLFSEAIKHYDFTLAEFQKELYHSHEDKFYKYIYLDTSLTVLSNSQFNWFRQEILSNKKIILFEDFDATAIPGGFEEYNFYKDAYNEKFTSLIKDFHHYGKIVASICTGAFPVAKSDILKNRKGTTYNLNPIRQETLRKMGVNVVNQPIVEDSNLIISWNPSNAMDVAFLLLEKLTNKKNADYIKTIMGFEMY